MRSASPHISLWRRELLALARFHQPRSVPAWFGCTTPVDPRLSFPGVVTGVPAPVPTSISRHPSCKRLALVGGESVPAPLRVAWAPASVAGSGCGMCKLGCATISAPQSGIGANLLQYSGLLFRSTTALLSLDTTRAMGGTSPAFSRRDSQSAAVNSAINHRTVVRSRSSFQLKSKEKSCSRVTDAANIGCISRSFLRNQLVTGRDATQLSMCSAVSGRRRHLVQSWLPNTLLFILHSLWRVGRRSCAL